MPTVDMELDAAVRASAMAYVQSLADRDGGIVKRSDLESFIFDGERLPLVDQSRGIRNPKILPATLTILTTKKSPYDDTTGIEGLLRYAMREGDPGSGDNRKLRRACELEVPLIWFQQIQPGLFAPVMPVYLVAEETQERRYVVALGEEQFIQAPKLLYRSNTQHERNYVESISKQRLHQPTFRAEVMLAYSRSCAVCELKHADLLDAAHIISDSDENGDPIVPNGLALCKIHHAAYDRNIMGISPDLKIHIDEDVLLEVDGPMLKHGLQEFHGNKLRVVPPRSADKPDRDRLAVRFEKFKTAG